MSGYFVSLKMQMPLISENIDSIGAEVDQLKKTMDDLGNIEELKDIIARAYESMKESNRAFQEYLNKVHETYGELSVECRAAVTNGSTQTIDQLIAKMKENIVASEQKYDKFSESNAAFVNNCRLAAEECQKLAEEQKTKQRITQVAGGLGTAAVGAAGITTTILVGVFTFGVGFAVGFPLTLAATAATASAAGITTAVVAQQFGKGAELFKEASVKAGRLKQHTSLIQENLNKFQKFNHNTSDDDGNHLYDIADQCDKLCDKLQLQSKKFSANFEIIVPEGLS